jgi:hypothetical protein
MQLLVHIWKNTETNGKQQLDNLNKDKQYSNSFSASTIWIHWATRQAWDNAISAITLVTWLFSKEQVRGIAQRILEIILYDTD